MVQATVQNIIDVLNRRFVRRMFLFAYAVVTVILGAMTYSVLVGTGFGKEGDTFLSLNALLKIDVVLLLLGLIFLFRGLVRLWLRRRSGDAGAQLQSRVVMIFSVLALLPAVLLTVSSLILFDLGIDAWFSKKIRDAVKGSQEVAESYLHEHRNTIKTEVLSIARDLSETSKARALTDEDWQYYLSLYARARAVSEAIIFNLNGGVKARYGLTAVLELEPISQESINQAASGEAVILQSNVSSHVRALIQLDNASSLYLVIGRFVDAKVVDKTAQTMSAVDSFERLEKERDSLKVSFAVVFILVALLLLITSVWLGLEFARRLVEPVSSLITVTDRLADGDYKVRADEKGDDEIARLGGAFNRMIGQLQNQRTELLEAAEMIDERRRFTEAVLLGVGSGIIGLDAHGKITLPNTGASRVLGVDLSDKIGTVLVDEFPIFTDVLEKTKRERRLTETQLPMADSGDGAILLVRATVEIGENDDILGYVLAFDDVSPLISAQRQAAWSDVARRIAHEIKNPLTPIQLSAERLKRKYEKQITDDGDVFATCTDTIIRQVGDIGRLVDEFSSFARMPSAVLKISDFRDVCRQAFTLQKNAHPYVQFEMDLPDNPLWVMHDSPQMTQVLTNLLQNAYDAIESAGNQNEGWISLTVSVQEEQVMVRVSDNGIGFPDSGRDKLLEPYMTTREQGTGLGLAIVNKIVEDHKGKMVLLDSQRGGAMVEIQLTPTEPPDENTGAKTVIG